MRGHPPQLVHRRRRRPRFHVYRGIEPCAQSRWVTCGREQHPGCLSDRTWVLPAIHRARRSWFHVKCRPNLEPAGRGRALPARSIRDVSRSQRLVGPSQEPPSFGGSSPRRSYRSVGVAPPGAEQEVGTADPATLAPVVAQRTSACRSTWNRPTRGVGVAGGLEGFVGSASSPRPSVHPTRDLVLSGLRRSGRAAPKHRGRLTGSRARPASHRTHPRGDSRRQRDPLRADIRWPRWRPRRQRARSDVTRRCWMRPSDPRPE